MLYEAANAFTRLTVAGKLSGNDVDEAWKLVEQIPIDFHSLTLAPQVVSVALRLRRRSAYDAAYMVLAERLGAVLWTLDGHLARNAASMGFPVRLVE